MVSEASDVQAFLAQHPPFNQLSDKHLELAGNHTFVAFSKSGDRLDLDDVTKGGPKTGLLMVRSGSMEVRDADGVLVDRLSSGDYLVPSVLTDSVRDPAVIVLEDSLYYELDNDAFQTLVSADADMAAVCKVDRPGADSAIHPEASQIYSPQAGTGQAEYLADRVRDVMSKVIVSAEPAMSIRDAASLMKQHHISSLLIKSSIDSSKPLSGIVTDRDFRIRVLAEGVPDDAPIASVMTPDPQTIEAASKINDAQLRMMAEGIRHLPVIDHGRIVGMISQTDILHANNIDPISLIYAINRSTSIEQLSEVADKIPALIARLVSRDTRAVEIGKILTTLSDAVTRRLIKIAEMQYGPAPCAYAWLAFGSQARKDQILGSEGHVLGAAAPARVLLDQRETLGGVPSCHQRAPRLGNHGVGAVECVLESVGDRKRRPRRLGIGLCLGLDLGHQAELGRAGEGDVDAEAGHHQDQALGHRQRPHVVRRRGPGDAELEAAGVAAEMFADGQHVGEDLAGVVDVALHRDHRDRGVLGHLAQVLVALAECAVADGDPLAVARQDVGRVLGILAVADLHLVRRQVDAVAAELGHARLERITGSRRGVEEDHVEGLVLEHESGLARRPFGLEVDREVE